MKTIRGRPHQSSGACCCVKGCHCTSKKCRGLSFLRLPAPGRSKRQNEWRAALIHAIGRKDEGFNSEAAKICSRHFEQSCLKYSFSGKCRGLRFGSLPTRWLPGGPPETIESAVEPETKSGTDSSITMTSIDQSDETTQQSAACDSKFVDTSHSSDPDNIFQLEPSGTGNAASTNRTFATGTICNLSAGEVPARGDLATSTVTSGSLSSGGNMSAVMLVNAFPSSTVIHRSANSNLGGKIVLNMSPTGAVTPVMLVNASPPKMMLVNASTAVSASPPTGGRSGVNLVDVSPVGASSSITPGLPSAGDISASITSSITSSISLIGEDVSSSITPNKVPTRKRKRKKRIFERTNVCGYCFATFSNSTMMERHILVHTGEKPFPCEVCGASFRQRAHLTEHMRGHTGEKPFRCTVCDALFTRSNSLKQHLASHAGTRRFQCEHCPATFMRQFDLKRHTKIHFFDGPHKCTLCTASFNNGSNLKKHMVIHCGEETYVRKRQKEFVINSDLDETLEDRTDGVTIEKDVTYNLQSALKSFTDSAYGLQFAGSESDSNSTPDAKGEIVSAPSNMLTETNVRRGSEFGEQCGLLSVQYIKQEPVSPSNQDSSEESLPDGAHASADFKIKTERIDSDMFEKIDSDRCEAAFHAASDLSESVLSDMKAGRLKPSTQRSGMNGGNTDSDGQGEINTENGTEVKSFQNDDMPEVKREKENDTEQDESLNEVVKSAVTSELVGRLASETYLKNRHIPADQANREQNVCSETVSKGRGLNLRADLKEESIHEAFSETSEVNPLTLTAPSTHLSGGHSETKWVNHDDAVKEEANDAAFSETCSVTNDFLDGSVSCQNETSLQHQGPVPVYMFRSNDLALANISENDLSRLEGQEVAASPLNNDCELPVKFEPKDVQGVPSSDKPYACTQCPAAFSQICHLRDHVRTHTGEKPFVCTLCTAAFARLSALKRHMYTHTDQKPFVCTTCSASFKQLCHLKQHMKTHSDTKIQCEYCDASFARRSELKDHVRKHTGEKPFVCSVCNAAFSRRESWRNHEKNHTSDKPFKCEYCEASFVWNKCLIAHRKAHFGKRPFACDHCSASFNKRHELDKHVKVHEPRVSSNS